MGAWSEPRAVFQRCLLVLALGCVGAERGEGFSAKQVQLDAGRAILESLSLTPNEAEKAGLPVKVTVVEPTGAETLVIGKVGQNTLQISLKERRHFAPGDDITVRPLPGAVHLFDAAGGKRLG